MALVINSSEYYTSSLDNKGLPKSTYPEIAFIGRSNVGKSSLINMIAGRNKLAFSSSKPGKTQLFNYYFINQAFYFVDLPGYGYAKISKQKRQQWREQFAIYFTTREQLVNVFLLIDSRIPAQKSDYEYITFFGEHELPFVICLTKTDEISSNQLAKKRRELEDYLNQKWAELPQIVVTSSKKGTGRDKLLEIIGELSLL